MMAALLAARGNRVIYESAQHLVAEVKIMHVPSHAEWCGWEQMFSLLIKINEFSINCEYLNTWDVCFCVRMCVYALC